MNEDARKPPVRVGGLDLRGLLRLYADRHELLTIQREVSTEYELAAVTDAVQRNSGQPLVFERVSGSPMPVATNLLGTRHRIAEVIGIRHDEFCQKWTEAMSAQVAWSTGIVDDGTPPARLHGRLSDLPLIKYFERDAAPYFTAGVFVGADPDTGVRNLSFHRAMYVNDHELRVRLAPTHHLTRYHEMAEARGEALEAAMILGAPPAMLVAAASPVPYEVDEYDVAARLAGRQIPVYRGTTVKLPLPVEAEVVVEGYFLPNERRPEGPFGEFMGYYTGGDNAVFEVSDVSWRPDPVFHSILCGSPEEVLLLELSVAASIYQRVSAVLPGIIDVACSPFVNQAVVKIHQLYEGHARQVLLAALGAELTWCKFCTVVDEDVDIYDVADVQWAILTRPRPDSALMVVDNVPSFYRDPHRDHWGRVGIDATAPFERLAEYVRKRIPGAGDVRLEDYIGGH